MKQDCGIGDALGRRQMYCGKMMLASYRLNVATELKTVAYCANASECEVIWEDLCVVRLCKVKSWVLYLLRSIGAV